MEIIAQIRDGALKGKVVDDIASFKDIPYAASPVGHNLTTKSKSDPKTPVDRGAPRDLSAASVVSFFRSPSVR